LEGQGRRFRAQPREWEQSSDGAQTALELLQQTLENRDPVTAEHGREVAALVVRLGHFLGLPRAELAELVLAARFHDIGKAAVPDRVLLKPGPLDGAEWKCMACHPEWGAELLRHLPGCEGVASIVRHHHERWDGGGYPDGLERRDIPPASRLIGVCDAYAAMVADRPYRPALHPLAARERLREGAGSQFDPDAVDALLEALLPPPFESDGGS
jgi:HD-GYP domain-containing protein (c-di-GMP phosphodiesterase class II)